MSTTTTARRITAFGCYSPWGFIDHVRQLADGITSVSTASHGGIHVRADLDERIPAKWREAARVWASEGWYEEDCCWCFVALTFPEAFPGEIDAARRTYEMTYADELGPLAVPLS